MMTHNEYQAAIREMREEMLLRIGCDDAPKFEDNNLCEDCLADCDICANWGSEACVQSVIKL